VSQGMSRIAEGEALDAPGAVSLRIPSSSEYVLLARLMVAQVGRIAGFSDGEIYDLKLAVTEAATNVVRHAAVDSFEIEYHARPNEVEIVVTDLGGGFDAHAPVPEPDEHGGFGLAVIRSLVDEVALDSTGDGTRLRMIYRVADFANSSDQ
jgi:serine/threonine-protein kinase RsbW